MRSQADVRKREVGQSRVKVSIPCHQLVSDLIQVDPHVSICRGFGCEQITCLSMFPRLCVLVEPLFLIKYPACTLDAFVALLLLHPPIRMPQNQSCQKLTESILGPDSGVASGECLHSLVGPFVGFHHQALLIATIWPLGRGNVGYGANVGSNHTSRQVGTRVFFSLNLSRRKICMCA